MFHSLPDGPLDIVGDVHGEADALDLLLLRLGYDAEGRHPAGRHLVFVGDLCDRGPDTPRVIERVRRIVEGGHGQAVLGNHEMNLLRGERKDGNDWFWDQASVRDRKYEPFTRVAPDQRQAVLRFFLQLPLALERADLRIVHAAWHGPSVQRLRAPGQDARSVRELFDHWDHATAAELQASGLVADSQAEKTTWAEALADPKSEMPLLAAVGRCDAGRQMGNPVRVLTSGVERLGQAAFHASGQWRFVERVAWWDAYEDDIPVVMGHYWRRVRPLAAEPASAPPPPAAPLRNALKGDPNLFARIDPEAWHGARGNVFCVDFSAGGRFHERRHNGVVGATTPLTALRWPERTLVFDHGGQAATTGFGEALAPA